MNQSQSMSPEALRAEMKIVVASVVGVLIFFAYVILVYTLGGAK